MEGGAVIDMHEEHAGRPKLRDGGRVRRARVRGARGGGDKQARRDQRARGGGGGREKGGIRRGKVI